MPYKALFDEGRWDNLIAEFRQENYRLFQLANQSVFTVALQAGLSALKTPYPFFAKLYVSEDVKKTQLFNADSNQFSHLCFHNFALIKEIVD